MNKEQLTKKLNNKGFSLVELIIVIAIMAVLVGVITPQYIKYVNKSKYGVDVQAMDSLRNAMNTTILDPTIASGSLSDGATGAIGSSALSDSFWLEVYEVFGIATKKADGSDRTIAEMTNDVKALLKLDNSSTVAINYTYSNGIFSISVTGGKYTGSNEIHVPTNM